MKDEEKIGLLIRSGSRFPSWRGERGGANLLIGIIFAEKLYENEKKIRPRGREGPTHELLSRIQNKTSNA